MSKLFVEDTSLSAIGDAIREKTGKTELLKLEEMPSEIKGIIADELPDWDEDSPIIASGTGRSKCVRWELTERGTMRWKWVFDASDIQTAYKYCAGWNNTINVGHNEH